MGPVTSMIQLVMMTKVIWGKLRVKATYRSMWRSDIVIILLDERGAKDIDLKFIAEVKNEESALYYCAK